MCGRYDTHGSVWKTDSVPILARNGRIRAKRRYVLCLLLWNPKHRKAGFAWILLSLLCTNNYSFVNNNPFLVQQIKMGCIEVVLHPQKV